MSDETIEWRGYVHHLGENRGPQDDDEVRLVLSADDRPDECWTVKRDVFDEPEELEAGTIVEVTASAEGMDFRIADVPEWTEEDIEAAKARAEELRDELFE